MRHHRTIAFAALTVGGLFAMSSPAAAIGTGSVGVGSSSIVAGGTTTVTVTLDAATVFGTSELTVRVTGGSGGSIALSNPVEAVVGFNCIAGPDAGPPPVPAGEVVCARSAGSPAPAVTLTMTATATADAAGTFTVTASEFGTADGNNPQSYIVGSATITVAPPATTTVPAPTTTAAAPTTTLATGPGIPGTGNGDLAVVAVAVLAVGTMLVTVARRRRPVV